MSTIIYPNQNQTLLLPAGQVLSLTNPSGSAGRCVRLALSPGGGNAQSTTIIAGADLSFGSYAQPERFEIFCTTGTVTYSMAVPDPALMQLDTEATAALALKVSHSLAIAESDFLVGAPDPFGTWIKKTLAQTKTILGLGGIVPTGTAENDFITAGADPFTWTKRTLAATKTILGLGTAAYTAATAYVTHAQAIAENDVLVGGPNPFGAWVKKTLAEFKTILELGTAAYTAATAYATSGHNHAGVYDAAGTAAGVIASSISDSDITHCPDGNSVFDALALKVDKASAAPVILAITEKTPVNAVAASKLLSIGTAPAEGATVSIGGVPYKFRAVLGAGVTASGALTFTGNAVDNETITIDTDANERIYTFENAIAVGGVAAHGHLTLTGNAVENETVTMGTGGAAKTYRWRDQIAAIAASKQATLTAVAANTETITVDTTPYTFKTALTEAKATGILTATANPQDGARVVIDSTTYTYRDTLAVAYDVKIGANAEASLLNLVRAITAGAGEGTLYGTGTVAHTSVTAAEGAGDTVDVTALAVGVAGNVISSVEYSPGLSWGGATLSGGLDPVLNEILVEAGTEAEIDNLVAAAMTGVGAGTKFSTGQPQLVNVNLTKDDATHMTATAKVAGTGGNSIAIAETCAQVAWAGGAVFLSGGYATAVANDVIIGGSAELSIDNLVLAVAAVTGSGVNWGVGTTAHTTIGGSKTAADIFTATALSVGDAGNAEATTKVMANATWGAGTLQGGEGVDTAYMVLIGVNAEASIDNLVAAINKAAGEGTTYGTGTVIHPTVSAAKTAADVLTATAKTVGTAGNAIDSESTVALATWAGAHLANGYDIQAANDVLIGTIEVSIDNLVLAITDGGVEGTNYGTGTVVNPLATAVKASAATMTATNLIKGVIGHATAIAETLADGSWAAGAVFLSGGIDGTAGVANETCVDGSYIYHAIAANDISEANWRRIALGSAY